MPESKSSKIDWDISTDSCFYWFLTYINPYTKYILFLF